MAEPPTYGRQNGGGTRDRGHAAIEIRSGGTTIGSATCLDFIGAGVSVVTDPNTGCAEITIPGGGGGGGTRQTVYDAQGAVPVVTTFPATLEAGPTLTWSLAFSGGALGFSLDDATKRVTVGVGATGLAGGPGYFNNAGAVGTGDVGSQFARGARFETEFGSNIVVGFFPAGAGRVGVLAEGSELRLASKVDQAILESQAAGFDVQVQTAPSGVAATKTGDVLHTTGDAVDPGAGGETGDVISRPGLVATVSGKPGIVHSQTALSSGTVITEAFPIHRFTNNGIADQFDVYVGAGDPNGVVAGFTGSTFHRDDGTTGRVYVNRSPLGGGSVWAGQLVDGDAASVFVFGNSATGASTAVRYLTQGYSTGSAPLAAGRIDSLATRPGTLRRLTVKHGDAGAGATMTYTVQVNGVDTGITVSMLASNTSVQIDASNLAAVVAGDEIGVKIEKSIAMGGGPGRIRASLEFVPTL
jgi:hypothetical protein